MPIHGAPCEKQGESTGVFFHYTLYIGLRSQAQFSFINLKYIYSNMTYPWRLARPVSSDNYISNFRMLIIVGCYADLTYHFQFLTFGHSGAQG